MSQHLSGWANMPLASGKYAVVHTWQPRLAKPSATPPILSHRSRKTHQLSSSSKSNQCPWLLISPTLAEILSRVWEHVASNKGFEMRSKAREFLRQRLLCLHLRTRCLHLQYRHPQFLHTQHLHSPHLHPPRLIYSRKET